MPDLNEGLSYSANITIAPTLTVAAGYVANDYVGTSGVCMTLAGCARVPGGTGYIQSAVLTDSVGASVQGELWIFRAAVVPPADSAAWTITDAEAKTLVCVLSFGTYFASAANSVSTFEGLPKGFKCAAGSIDLFACFVTRGAPAYAATGDVSFNITIIQD